MQELHRRKLKGTAGSLLRLGAVVGLAAVASVPFWPVAPTRSIDGPLHLYRLVELDHCLASGSLFPRWAPDLVQGYGFPLFNYYPPLAYYLAEAWHLLGFSLARSLSLTFILGVALSSISMYLLAKDFSGEKGAVLAALLYVYAPFWLYNSVCRGGLAEVLAWAIAPLVLWAFHRLAVTHRQHWLIVASLSYAAFLLTHHLSALTFTPLLILFQLGHWVTRRNWKSTGYALAALALGIGISAFFTVPAFFERSFIQIDRVFASAGFDYHNHFVSLQSLLAGPAQTDVSLMNPGASRPIGWIHIAMGLVGSLGLLALRPARRHLWHLAALPVALALFIMLQSPSARAWEVIGLARYLQFPWRLLAPLSLVLAFMGAGVGLLLPGRSRLPWPEAALIAVIAFGLFLYDTPLLYHLRHPLPSTNPDLADLLEFERAYWLPSLTSNLDYLPIWVEKVPDQSPMAEEYAASLAITRLDTQSLPAGATVREEAYGLNDLQIAYDSPVAFRAQVNQFYFPGWRAYVDGSRAQVTPLAPYGLIGVDLPAGTHDLCVRFEGTPLRMAGNLVSLLCLLALVGVGWAGRRRGAGQAQQLPAGGTLAARDWALLLLVAASFVAVKALWFDKRDSWFRVTSLHDGHVEGVQNASQINFGNEMLLLGYDLPTLPVAADDPFAVRLYWRALRRMAVEYSTTVQLVDEQGRLWGQHDSWHPGEYPTVRWETDAYNLDKHSLLVLPGTPPGEYSIRVSVYALGTVKGLDVLDGNGTPIGTSTVLGTVRVTRPQKPPALDTLGIQHAIAAQPNEDLELLGSNLPAEPVRPGQRIRLTLFWRATRRPGHDHTVVATLLGPDGEYSSQVSWPVAGVAYPTSAWQQGEIIRAQYDLRVPAGAPPGTGTLAIALSDPSGAQSEPVTIGQLEVLPVAHRMDVPAMERAVGADLGHEITLLGYDLDRREVERGQAIHLTLYWQAQREMADEYKVFTHLLDRENRITAQHDSSPVQGTRPTTSWIAGEVVADDYELVVRDDAPTGEHLIEVGIYDPLTGRRLTLFDAEGQVQGDRVLLESIRVR